MAIVYIEDGICTKQKGKNPRKMILCCGFWTVTGALAIFDRTYPCLQWNICMVETDMGKLLWTNACLWWDSGISSRIQHMHWRAHVFSAFLNIQSTDEFNIHFSLSMQYSNVRGFADDLRANESMLWPRHWRTYPSASILFKYGISKIILYPFSGFQFLDLINGIGFGFFLSAKHCKIFS